MNEAAAHAVAAHAHGLAIEAITELEACAIAWWECKADANWASYLAVKQLPAAVSLLELAVEAAVHARDTALRQTKACDLGLTEFHMEWFGELAMYHLRNTNYRWAKYWHRKTQRAHERAVTERAA